MERRLIRLSCKSFIFALACATTAALGHAAAQGLASNASAIAAAPRQLLFSVIRNGSKIGDYQMSVATEGKTQKVDFTTDIKVTVLMFTAYHLHHSGQEIWTDGKFVSYKGTTNDNGKTHTVSLVPGPQTETLSVDGHRSQIPKGAIPASLWNTKFVDATTLIDPDSGKQFSVKADDEGLDPVKVEGAQEMARHYHVQGLDREVWMIKGSPVRFQLTGSDKSIIVSELQPTPAP